jgi:hypothetical protein
MVSFKTPANKPDTQGENKSLLQQAGVLAALVGGSFGSPMAALPTVAATQVITRQIPSSTNKVDWSSKRNTPFPPDQDEESKLRGAGVVAATVGAGLTSPLHALNAYVASKTVAATPSAVPAPDMSAVEKKMPATMPEVIDALLGKNSKNRGVVFGDTDHDEIGIHEAVFDKEGIKALKRNGVTHIFIEQNPDAVPGLTKPEKASLAMQYYYLNNHYAQIIKEAEKEGIKVVGMDMTGPYVEKVFYPGLLDREDKDVETLSNGEFKTRAEAERLFSEERVRVTNQVWTPRIVELMKQDPKAKFVAIGGSMHIDNPGMIGSADIMHADFDETLAKSLNEPVPYVRIASGIATRQISVEKGKSNPFGYGDVLMDIPQLTVNVPSYWEQKLEKSALKNLSGKSKSDIGDTLQNYHHIVLKFLANSYPKDYNGANATNQAAVQNSNEIQMLHAFHAVEDKVLSGKIPEAKKSLEVAKKLFTRSMSEGHKVGKLPPGESVEKLRISELYFSEMETQLDLIKDISVAPPEKQSPFGGISDFIGSQKNFMKLPPCDAPGAPNVTPAADPTVSKETKR